MNPIRKILIEGKSLKNIKNNFPIKNIKILLDINLEGRISSKTFIMHNIDILRGMENVIRYFSIMNEASLSSRNDRVRYSNTLLELL